jgi:hypothetical protein
MGTLSIIGSIVVSGTGSGSVPFPSNSGTLLDAMTTMTGWSLTIGDGGGWKDGTVSIREDVQGPEGTTWLRGWPSFLTTDTGACGARIDKTFSSVDISEMKNIGFYIGLEPDWNLSHDPARLWRVHMWIGSDGDKSFDNSVVATFDVNAESLSAKLVRLIQCNREDFSLAGAGTGAEGAGSFDWSNLRDVRIQYDGSDGTVGSGPGIDIIQIMMQGLRIDRYIIPTVIVCHDDGPSGVYDLAYAELESRSIQSTQFIVPDLADAGGASMTVSELTEMYADGHDMSLHATESGDVLNTMTIAAIVTDLSNGLTWMDTNSFTRAKHIISYPQGVTVSSGGTDVADTFVDQNVFVGRGDLLWYTPDVWSHGDKDQTGKNNKAMSACWRDIDTSNNPYATKLSPALDRLAKYGGILFVTFHNVVSSGASGAAINLSDYTAALDEIKVYEHAGKIQIKRASDVYDTDGSLLI